MSQNQRPDLPTITIHSRPSTLGRKIAILLIAVPCIVNLVIHLLPQWWVSDMFIHFRIHYLVIGLVGFALALVWRRFWLVGLAASAVALNIAPVYWYFDEPGLRAAQASNISAAQDLAPFRIGSANIHAGNRSFAQVADWITKSAPDVVALIEATAPWQIEMRRRLIQYPYQELVIAPGRSGKLILSKLPFERIEILPSIGARSPTPVIAFESKRARFRLVALHANWPMKKNWAADRNHDLTLVSATANADSSPFIAVGDFNVSPFSRHFADMLKSGNLRRTAAGRGWLPTWPTFFLAVGIQIDHILTSPQVRVAKYQVGADINSDHRWIVADLLVPTSDK